MTEKNTAELDLGSEAFASVVAKFTMSGLGFVGVVAFAYVLGPAGVGRYYFALAIALLLVRVDAGIGVALKKRVSQIETDAGTYLTIGLLFHAVWVCVVAAGTLAVGRYTDLLPMTPLVVSGVVSVVATVGLFQILNRFYAGLGYPSRSLWIDTVRSAFTLGLQLAFLIQGYRAFGLLVGLAGGTLISAGIVFVAAGVRPTVTGLRETATNVFEFARYSVPTAVVEDFYKRIDVILIRLFAGEAAVGFYETALRIITPAQQLSGSISNALGVKVSGLTSIGREIRADIVNAVIYTGLLAIPMFFGALAMPAALMQTFFGSEFAGGATALVGIALFYVFYIYQDPFATALEGSDRPRIVFRLRLLALGVHLPLALLLGYYWDGLLGVIAATLIVEIILLAIYQLVSHRELGGVIVPKPVAAQLGSAVVMYVTITLIKQMIPLVSWVPVIGLVVFGAGTYFISLAVLSGHFRLTLGNILLPALQRMRARLE